MNPETTDQSNDISRRKALKRVGLILGGALSAPAVSGVLSGCRPSTSESWTPSALSAEQNEMVTAMSEHIIPATDTPGAKAAQVNRFIDKMMAEWYSQEERGKFLTGLEEVNTRCRQKHGQPFLECSEETQFALLEHLDQEAFDSESDQEGETQSENAEEDPADAGETKKGGAERTEESIEQERAEDTTRAVPESKRPVAVDSEFYRLLKELTLLGYYTSEIGMNRELNVTIVPGRYDGCVPLKEVRPNIA